MSIRRVVPSVFSIIGPNSAKLIVSPNLIDVIFSLLSSLAGSNSGTGVTSSDGSIDPVSVRTALSDCVAVNLFASSSLSSLFPLAFMLTVSPLMEDGEANAVARCKENSEQEDPRIDPITYNPIR